jgi:hypothetical protein
MTWRNNAIATTVLTDQGYYVVAEDQTESTGDLQTKLVVDKLVQLFLKDPALASSITDLNRDTVAVDKGLTPEDVIVHMVGRNWYDQTVLTEAEAKTLRGAAWDEHWDLRERKEALAGLQSLFWASLCKDSKDGEVQRRLVTEVLDAEFEGENNHLLLIEVKRSGAKPNLKFATNDEDLIMEHYITPRGDKVVVVSTKVGQDCRMVANTFQAMLPAMRKQLGGQLTTSLVQLLPVAEPDTNLLFPGNGQTAIAAPKK